MTQPEVLIGVSGGIAAYKTAALVSQLVQSSYGVTVIMTQAAERFVGPATFAALTGRPVARQLIDDDRFPLGAHMELAERGQLLCIAPATANQMAKMVQAIADDLLSTLYLSFAGPVLVAPAMSTSMWEKPAVQRNLQQLRADGVQIVDPQQGWLSCRKIGIGRMSEPDTILAAIQHVLPPHKG